MRMTDTKDEPLGWLSRQEEPEETGFIWWSKVIVGSALTLFVLWALCVLIMAMPG